MAEQPSPPPRISNAEPIVLSPDTVPTESKVVLAATRAKIGSDKMPSDLRDQLLELEEWATLNRRDARNDTIAFWTLKVPAILASASAGVLAHFDLTTVSVFAGAVAGVCVIIDGVHPRGMLRNAHLRAHHDIRILISNMMSEWRSRNTNANIRNVASKIIRDAEKERQRIASFVRDAETALNFKEDKR